MHSGNILYFTTYANWVTFEDYLKSSSESACGLRPVCFNWGELLNTNLVVFSCLVPFLFHLPFEKNTYKIEESHVYRIPLYLNALLLRLLQFGCTRMKNE